MRRRQRPLRRLLPQPRRPVWVPWYHVVGRVNYETRDGAVVSFTLIMTWEEWSRICAYSCEHGLHTDFFTELALDYLTRGNLFYE